MNSISVYFECFDPPPPQFSDLHSDCVDIVSSIYISINISHCVSYQEAYAVEA